MQAALIQAIVLRYFEQIYGNDVTIYGEIVNDIDIFSKQVKYLKGEDICTFLTNLKDENIDYLESIEVKHETPKNFCMILPESAKLKNILQVIKKCPYSEKTKLKLVIVPTSYRIEEVENLKKCNELKNKFLSIIKTDEDKAVL